MRDAEWSASDDPVAMLETLRANWRGDEADLVILVNRYLLACCRAIWPLLPLDASRHGVEVAERFLDGQATREEFGLAEWQAEGAAFFLEPSEWQPEEEDSESREARIQYDAERRERVAQLVRDVKAIPAEQMRLMVRSTEGDETPSTHQLLSDAAYFADDAMVFSRIKHRDEVIRRFKKFLSPELLRRFVDGPISPRESRR